MKEIPLTQNKVALVDDQDFDWLNQWNWFAFKQRDGDYYAVRYESTPKRSVYMHVEVAARAGQRGFCIDHIDRSKLHNWRSNLRASTKSQDEINQPPDKSNKSGYKGVAWVQCRQKYQATIRINYKSKNLGRFESKIEAARAYDKAAKEFFGDRAWLNFP